MDLDSVPNFDTYGLALGCPEPLTPDQPLDFSKYFKIFYEKSPHLFIRSPLFGECVTGLSRLLTRFEAIQDQPAFSRASEYSDMWYSDMWFSLLAARNLHVGLKNRSKLMPSTEVYSPQYVACQFGFVQALLALAKFFMANTARRSPPTKSVAEANRILAMRNRLRRFLKLVSSAKSCRGMDFRFTRA